MVVCHFLEIFRLRRLVIFGIFQKILLATCRLLEILGPKWQPVIFWLI